MMKSRTFIGIACIVLAVLLMIFVVPWLSKREEETVPVLRAKSNIARGTQITERMVEVVQVRADARQNRAVSVLADAVGKYAGCDIFAGDTLTEEKLKENANGVSDALYRLRDGEYAVTVSFGSSTKGFSGQLENGDIVKIFTLGNNSEIQSPQELQYVRVITTLTQNGASRDSAKVGAAGGDTEKTSSVMFAVTAAQAEILFRHADKNTLFCAFVCHESDPRAEEYLKEQDNILQKLQKEVKSGGIALELVPAEGPADGN